MSNFLVTLLALLLVITFHEYGHFRTMKKFGLTSPVFSIGFGPKLFSIHHAGTEYMVCLFPLAGFVTFPEDWEGRLTSWQKIRVMFAGPWANVITAIPFGLALVFLTGTFAEYQWWFVVLLVVLGTPVFFVVSIPLTIMAVVMMYVHPVTFVDNSQGVIGAIAEGRPAGESLLAHFLSTMYFFSVGVASFNLLPLSFLDGGKIFANLLAKYPRFLKYWMVASTGVLLSVVVLLNGGDILQALGWL